MKKTFKIKKFLLAVFTILLIIILVCKDEPNIYQNKDFSGVYSSFLIGDTITIRKLKDDNYELIIGEDNRQDIRERVNNLKIKDENKLYDSTGQYYGQFDRDLFRNSRDGTKYLNLEKKERLHNLVLWMALLYAIGVFLLLVGCSLSEKTEKRLFDVMSIVVGVFGLVLLTGTGILFIKYLYDTLYYWGIIS